MDRKSWPSRPPFCSPKPLSPGQYQAWPVNQDHSPRTVMSKKKSKDKPVAIIMGSQSDWPTMKHAADILDELGVGHEALIVSAHRTPERLYEFAKSARQKGFKVVIAGAGGAAHLPGMTASLTPLPVFGVPMNTTTLEGKDSLLSILQMPPGVPVG